MSMAMGTEVGGRWAGYVLVALVFLGGCTPRHVVWRETNTVVQPQGAGGEVQEKPAGYLVIEMRHLGQPGDQEMERYPPVYLYDQTGHFLNQLPNNTEYPKALRSGEYIVLIGETDPCGPFRQVQVRVETGRTTTVSLAEIGGAPRL